MRVALLTFVFFLCHESSNSSFPLIYIKILKIPHMDLREPSGCYILIKISFFVIIKLNVFLC